jgi:hypothetical protein
MKRRLAAARHGCVCCPTYQDARARAYLCHVHTHAKMQKRGRRPNMPRALVDKGIDTPRVWTSREVAGHSLYGLIHSHGTIARATLKPTCPKRSDHGTIHYCTIACMRPRPEVPEELLAVLPKVSSLQVNGQWTHVLADFGTSCLSPEL